MEASAQLVELQSLLQQIQPNPNECDKWSFIWNSEEYISKKAYLQIIGINNASPIFNYIGCGNHVPGVSTHSSFGYY
jgi:hypothetical protein